VLENPKKMKLAYLLPIKIGNVGYKQRSEEYGFPVDPPEHILTFEGVKLNQQV
jgi:hypothetical protein